MARTQTFNSALTASQALIKRGAEDNFAVLACNMAVQHIWNKADWRESIKELEPFWLRPWEQDHGSPIYTIPSDFLGLRDPYLVNLQGTTPIKTPLTVQSNLERTPIIQIPTRIGYQPSLSAFRLWPRVPSGICSPAWLVEGNYKKRPVKVDISTLNTTLPWDDEYFNQFLDTLVYYFWKLAGDPRAGQIQYNASGMQAAYTGKIAEVEEGILRMLEQENLNAGNPAIAPYEPLVGSNYGLNGFFPW